MRRLVPVRLRAAVLVAAVHLVALSALLAVRVEVAEADRMPVTLLLFAQEEPRPPSPSVAAPVERPRLDVPVLVEAPLPILPEAPVAAGAAEATAPSVPAAALVADVAVSAPTLPQVAEPAYLRAPRPLYPAQSRARREDGVVLLRVRVSTAGVPIEVEVVRSSGYLRLDEAALLAVREARFVPYRDARGAQVFEALVPLEFRLRRGA